MRRIVNKIICYIKGHLPAVNPMYEKYKNNPTVSGWSPDRCPRCEKAFN